MNGDGRKDVLIARKKKSMDAGQLVWFEHPATGALEDIEWTEHIITEGPDVFTAIEDLGGNELQVWASQFYSKNVAVYKISTASGTAGDVLNSRVFDSADIALNGQAPLGGYQVTVVDLNGDGNKQILFNNWEGESENGIWVYEVPADPYTGTFVKHEIASGFKIPWKYWFTGISGPGYPFLFYPDGNTSTRAHILVDGHGSDELYLLTPVGNAANFEY